MKRLFLEWAKTRIFRTKVEDARNIILRYANMRFYVAVSGGKDSLALLHLVVHTIEKPIDVFHWDHGPYLMPRKIENDILECIKAISPRIRLHVLSSPKLFSKEARWNYIMWYRAFYGKLRSFTKKHEFKVAFLGLREEESISRRRRASKICERDSSGVLLVYPLHSWTWLDVWAYIFSSNIRYPKIYDKLVRIYGWRKARLVTFYDKEFEHFGSIEISKYLLPEEKEID